MHIYIYIHKYICVYIHTNIFFSRCIIDENYLKFSNVLYIQKYYLKVEMILMRTPYYSESCKRSRINVWALSSSLTLFRGFKRDPIVIQWKQALLVSVKMKVQSLALLSELNIQLCCELWCRWHTWLGSSVAWHRLAGIVWLDP